VLVGRASVLVGRASVPVYRSHPGIRRRRISGIQTKTVLSALGPQSSLLPTASCQLYFPMPQTSNGKRYFLPFSHFSPWPFFAKLYKQPRLCYKPLPKSRDQRTDDRGQKKTT